MRRRRVTGIAAVAAIVGGALAPAVAQQTCDAASIRGLRPGMTVKQVREAMGGRAERYDHETVNGVIRTASVYARTPYTVVVRYDGEVTRRSTSARVVSIEERADPSAVDVAGLATALVERLGSPPGESVAPFADDRTATWRFGPCGLVVEAFRAPGNWWNPASGGSLTVRLARIPVEERAPDSALVVRRERPAASPEDAPTPAARAEPRDATRVPPRDAGRTGAASDDSSSSPVSRSEPIAAADVRRAEAPTTTPEDAAGASGDPLAALRAAAERPPERLAESYAEPTFPALARRLRLRADVVLDIVVRRDGTVGDIVVSSSTLPGYGFEDAAIDAVRRWRYRPGTRDGRPIDAPLSIVVTFR